MVFTCFIIVNIRNVSKKDVTLDSCVVFLFVVKLSNNINKLNNL